MKTFCFKLYKAKRNQKLHKQINAAGLTYNYCIALHKRYYRLYHKSLNVYQLQKHLTKLKKIKRFSYLNEIGSQAVQDITQRIDRAYKLFFDNLKRKVRTAPPSFKKIKKYKSFTLKQTGYKLCDNATIIIGKQKYKFFKSRDIDGVLTLHTTKVVGFLLQRPLHCFKSFSFTRSPQALIPVLNLTVKDLYGLPHGIC